MDLLAAHLAFMGHATTTHALALAGIPQHRIAALVESAALVRVRRGAYVAPAEQDPYGLETHRRRAAAILRSAEGCLVASHLTAAVLHGLPVLDLPVKVEVARTDELSRRGSAGVTFRGLVPAAMIGTAPEPYGDVPAVDRATACAQVALTHGGAAGMVTTEGALRAGVRLERVAAALAAVPGQRGREVAEQVIGLAGIFSESPAESLARWVLHLLGVAARQQVTITDREGFVGRVDFLIGERTVLEVDGMGKYTDPSALRDEKRREDRLRRAGYRVIRLTWADLRDPSRARALLRAGGVLVR